MNSDQRRALRTGLTFCVGTLLLAAAAGAGEEVRHRFLALDESRDQLHHVDQFEASKDWTIKLPAKHRDLQLVGGQRVLLTYPGGYHEYRLTDRELVKEVRGFPGATSARRLPDGRTILACNDKNNVLLYELGPDDQPLRKTSLPIRTTRLMRLTTRGTVLCGSGNQVTESDLDGKTLHTWTLPEGTWVYQALQTPAGRLLAVGGYDPALLELDAGGRILRTRGGKQSEEAGKLGYHFFGAFQVLADGGVVVCNWTGHGPQDSSQGTQIVQYNAAGRLVWKWHDPQRAGSINGVIVLDGLDTNLLHDDASSVLGPVK
jgi:hypothetical protein